MNAYVFPGQGAQFEGMGKELYTNSAKAKQLFDQADDILGYRLTEVMFEGNAEDLKATKITQPALFVHGIALLHAVNKPFESKAVAGHSLGEFTALTAAGALTFEDGLSLVYTRAMAMQEACEQSAGTMAAVLGLSDEAVEEVLAGLTNEVVVAANYNCPGQLVISGSLEGIALATEALKTAGAKRAIVLPVGGAFHSPLMDSARQKLADAVERIKFVAPTCPIYQNVTASPIVDPEQIKINLVTQLTGSVRWTQSVQNMIADGITSFTEVGGSGKVLCGLIGKINRNVETNTLTFE